jgi:hypothetical protein
MQIVDAAADGLRARGFIDHRFSARRARLFDETLVSISGTELFVVDLADRDDPSIISSLTIAWPVREALPFGDSLVQLESGEAYAYDATTPLRNARLRITPKSDVDALDADVDLGLPGEVAGATIRGNKLYTILRSSSSRVIDEANGQRWEWLTELTTLVVNLADPGGPRVEGSAPSVSAQTGWGGGRLDAHWLPDGRLLWYPSRTTGNMWFRCLMCAVPLDGLGVAADIAGPWWWWGGVTDDFLVIDVADPAHPRVVVREALIPDSSNVWSARAILTANNRLLASWTASRFDNDQWIEESIVQEIDLSDSAAPGRGPKATVPGTLEGFHRTNSGGVVLFTSRAEVITNADNSTTWTSNAVIEALAYDGAQAFLLDSIRAEGSAGMSAVTSGPHVIIPAQPWTATDQSKGVLHVIAWNEAAGKLGALPDLAIGPGWPSLIERGGFVFAAGSGRVDVIAAHQLPSPPASAVYHVDASVWDASNLTLDPLAKTAWLPMDLYGVERLDLSSLPHPPAAGEPAPRDGSPEWQALALSPLDVVPAGGLDVSGPLLAGDDFRFAADGDAETYSEWQDRYFTEPFGPEAFVLGDPDRDGFDNYAEWAFGTSPVDPLSQPAVTVALVRPNPGGPARLAIVARLNPLAQVDPLPIGSYLHLGPEISTDIESWRAVEPSELEVTATPVSRSFLLPASTGNGATFGRLRVFFVIEG